jgi:hypothetical protein
LPELRIIFKSKLKSAVSSINIFLVIESGTFSGGDEKRAQGSVLRRDLKKASASTSVDWFDLK